MECVVTAEMSEVSQLQPAFSRVRVEFLERCFVAFKERPGKPP